MNEEEKKAIENLKTLKEYMGDNYTFSMQGIRNLREQLKIILNLIEKQDKVIKEYETLLKRQEKLEQEKDILKKQGWL